MSMNDDPESDSGGKVFLFRELWNERWREWEVEGVRGGVSGRESNLVYFNWK